MKSNLIIATVAIFAIAPKAQAEPAMTIFNQSGYGASGGTVYLQSDYQHRTRGSNRADGELGIGVGLGNAKDLAIDLNYTINSFGTSGKFGDGAFSAKLHRQISDDTSVAIGYNQFSKIGNSDYPNLSIYGSATKVFVTKAKVAEPFSRVAVTLGYSGSHSVFSSVAIKATKQVSVIAEYTGKDLAGGISIQPFENVPLTVTPAMRDGGRFTLGVGYGLKF